MISKAVQAGSFRSDLYYRLNVIPLHVPALRERRSDIPQLVQAFLQKYTKRMGKPIESVSRDAMKLLVDYSWPGNIRELQNVIERGVVLSRALSSDSVRISCQLRLRHPWRRRRLPRMETATHWKKCSANIFFECWKTDGVISGPRGAGAILDIHPNTLRSLMSRLGIRRALQAAS